MPKAGDRMERTVASLRAEEPAVVSERVTMALIVRDPSVRVALLIIFVIMIGFGIVAPILPLYARSFGVSYETASLLISMFALARLVVDPIAGPMVDRWGERRTSMIGVLIVGVSAFLTGLAPNFMLAVLLRAAGGAGSSILFAALYSYLLKVVPPDRMGRTFSLFYGSVNVGIIAGGPIGGLVAHLYGLSAPLFTYAALCMVGGFLYMRYMKEPPRRAPERAGGPSGGEGPAGVEAGEGAGELENRGGWRAGTRVVARLLRSPAFLLVLALNFSFFWVVAGGYDTMVPLFGSEVLGLSTVGVGAIFAVTVLTELAILYPAGSAADRFGRKRILVPGLLGLAVFMAAIGWATGPVALGVIVALVGLFSGAVAPLPSSILSDIVPGGSGTAVGVFRFAGDLGFVLGPLVGGIVANAFGFRWAFAVMGLLPALVLLLAIRVPETLRRTGEGAPAA